MRFSHQIQLHDEQRAEWATATYPRVLCMDGTGLGGEKKTEERGESEAQDERETLIMSHMCTGKLSGNTGEQQTQQLGTWQQPPNKQHALFMIIKQGQGG